MCLPQVRLCGCGALGGIIILQSRRAALLLKKFRTSFQYGLIALSGTSRGSLVDGVQ